MKRLISSNIIRGVKIHVGLLFLGIITTIAFIPVFTYLYFAKDLGSKDRIMNRNNTGIVLLDKSEKPFFTFYEARHKEVIPLKQIPKHVQQAIIAAEDKEFYTHPGFSFRGIIRSLFLDVKEGQIAYGGSTITQQLVKNALLTSKRSFLRKYQEIVLAQEIERRYSKPEILEMYLNSVYFGEGAFGIQQAAKTYFGKDVSAVTISEAALLAGILPAPSKYSPFRESGSNAKKRQELVLAAMRSQNYISRDEEAKVKQEKLVYKSLNEEINSIGAHFALMVREELLNKYGEERISRSGFVVKTTLDIEWQKFAEQTVKAQVERLSGSNVTNGAAVAIDPKSGEVRMLVGSVDWYNEKYGKVNIANTPRSPGSAFKPLIYASALERRLITAATPLHDVPTTFQKNYRPQNYDRKFRGTVLARRALANSLNVPSVEVMQKVGVAEGLQIAKRLGITTLLSPSDYGLSLVLGTGEVKLTELTNAYATFANNGKGFPITLVQSITDKSGHIIYKSKHEEKQVVEPAVAFIISSILSDNNARAEMFGNVLDTRLTAAVKTGTGEDYKNALTVGYTPALAVGVWLGNNDNVPMGRVAGSIGPAPIWRTLLEKYSEGQSIATFTPPSTVTKTSICTYSGLLASRNFGSAAYSEYFISGTQPTRNCFIPKPTAVPDQNDKDKEIKEKIDKFFKDNDRGRGRGSPFSENSDEIQQRVQEEVEAKIQEQLQQLQNSQQILSTSAAQ